MPPAVLLVPVVPAVGSLIVPPVPVPVVVEPPVPGVLTPDDVEAPPRARVEERELRVVERVLDCGVVVWVELADGDDCVVLLEPVVCPVAAPLLPIEPPADPAPEPDPPVV